MPIYEYLCPNGHLEEMLYNTFEDSPKERECNECVMIAKKVTSAPKFKLGWVPVVMDAKNVWEGTPLAGTDGKNRVTYRSTKVQVDQGAAPTVINGVTKKRPTKGVGALGI